MTVINYFAKGERGIAASDTAAYDPEGNILAFIDKLNVIEDLRMVVMVRGHWEAGGWLADDIASRFASFDEFVSQGKDFIRAFHAENEDALADSGNANIDVGLIGWSERNRRAEGYHISSQDARPVGTAPFTFARDDILLAPYIPVEKLSAAGLWGGQGLIGTPEHVLTTCLDIQRATPVEYCGEERFIIGGSLMMATVTEKGVEKRLVKSWGDRIGERISAPPMPLRKIAHTPQPLNRQQRRAMERAARKGKVAA